MTRPTIFALATGAPPTAIAIVRLSGPAAFATLEALTGRSHSADRRLVRCAISDPANGEIIDHGMVVGFRGPATVTGDDVVELHLHGGTAVVAKILAVLGRRGLTAATSGAFTRRAFDNGKLDLGAVEALGDLIAAETEGQRRAALARSGSDLDDRVDAWRSILIAVRADAEATLDFADEDGVDPTLSSANRAALSALRDDLRRARDSATRGALLRDGVTIAIVGPANAGKSTLLNALARRDAAMVSSVPGTTRDVIEVRLSLDGVLAVLVDTAGIRTTDDPLEREGISRGAARAARAEIVISLAATDRDNVLVVAAKSDLRGVAAGWRDGILDLSAETGDGVELLEAELARRVAKLTRLVEPIVVVHRWQVAALDAAADAVANALAIADIVVAADELCTATSALERITGRVATDDLLDSIFARFCIGK